MSRPFVYREDEGRWWAILEHDGWEQATTFDSWDLAIDHALWLHATGRLDGRGDA